ncbi:MAG: thioredoxin family protein [Pirellulales bacterium]
MIKIKRSMPWSFQAVVALCLTATLSAGSFAQTPELKGFENIFDTGKVDPQQEHGQLNSFAQPNQKAVGSAAELSKPKQSKAETTQGKLRELQKDLNEAHQLATLEGRPLLAIFGADWCTWCRKLELELQDDPADKIFNSWIVVKIDADRSPELAEKMNVSALPALRVLDFQLNQIAAREGYMPMEQLETWLDEKYSAANPVVGQVLFGTGQLSTDDVEQLVALLADRSPKIRAAAQSRLTQFPARTAKPVTEVFIGGKLSQKLASQQILKSWKAPVDSIDPWTPGTFTTEHRELLEKWLAEMPVEKLIEEAQSGPDSSTDTTQIHATLEELLRTSNNQGFGNIELSPAIVPAINQALEAENLTDVQREMFAN